MDTDSFYLALSEHDLYDCILPPLEKQSNSLGSGDCTDDFSANSTKLFVLVLAVIRQRSTIDENLAYCKKISDSQK